MKTQKCIWCKTRVTQAKWKTELENKQCFTCNLIVKTLHETAEAMSKFFKRNIHIELKEIKKI